MNTSDVERGRYAESPQEIPKKGLVEVIKRAWREAKSDNIAIIAAGVAFYGFLSIFPALAAMVAIYGLVLDPADVTRHVAQLATVLPKDALSIVESQLASIASGGSKALGFGLIFSILLAVWSANKGTKSLLTALNIAYDEEEKRGTIRFNLISLALTFGAIVVAIAVIAMVAVLPAVFDAIGLGGAATTLIAIGRWPVLALIAITGLAALFRYGPSRDEPMWRWATPGAILGTLLWLGGSLAFSLYVSKLGDFNKTYGSLGAVVVLMLWLFLTAYVVLLSAELNAEMEHQTAKDTTRGPKKPMGQRGAYVADTLPSEG